MPLLWYWFLLLWFLLFLFQICVYTYAVQMDIPWFLLNNNNKINNTSTESNYKTCETKICYENAKYVMESLNKSVNPCDDFYAFACGGWQVHHKIPMSEASWSPLNILETTVSEQIERMLSYSDRKNEPDFIKSSKNFFHACTNIDALEDIGVEPILTLLNKFGGWPIVNKNWSNKEFSLNAVLIKLSKFYNIEPLIKIYISPDMKKSSQNILYIDQPETILPQSMLRDPFTYITQIHAYGQWIVKTALELVHNNKTDRTFVSNIKTQVNEIVGFEMRLATILTPRKLHESLDRSYNKMTLQQLQTRTDMSISDSCKHKVKIKWTNLINGIFDDINVKFNASSHVVVTERDYLYKLSELLAKTPSRIIANYLGWHVVQKFARDTSKQMRLLSFEIDKVLFGVGGDLLRSRECINQMMKYMDDAVGFLYVKHFFKERTKYKVEHLFELIKTRFINALKDAKWMDNSTRSHAIEKATNLKDFTGFPDWYRNNSVLEHKLEYLKGIKSDTHFLNILSLLEYSTKKSLMKINEPSMKKDWGLGPATINAGYSPPGNYIVLPAGILQFPLFVYNRPESLNFGAIGTMIGHEIAHSFDNIGREIDKFGNVAQWWSDVTLESYLEKVQCFINQYNQFHFVELEKIANRNITVDGVLTQSENIADSIGLQQAYTAYIEYMGQKEDVRLPGLTEFSPKQLFFISYAMTWCESTKPEELLRMILIDPHSPNKARVWGTLSNSKHFAEAFQCSTESPMNPSSKCSLW